MLTYRHVVTFGGADQIWLSALSDLQIASVGGQNLLIAANLVYGKGITSYRFTSADIPLIAVDRQAYLGSFTYLGAPRLTTVTANNQPHVTLTHLGGAEGMGLSLSGNGKMGGFADVIDDLGAGLTALGQFQLGSSSYVYSATKGSPGFVVDRLGGDGSLTRITQVDIPKAGQSAGAAIDRIVELTSGGQKFLIAVSSLGDFVSTHPILAGGQIGTGTMHGGLLGAGYAVPTQLVALETGGRSFVVLGASASSSLTVFQLMPDGRLQSTDHVIDELTTRFQSITALDAVTVAGRAYIFAGGVDGGISVLTLQPDGRLLHLDTIVDTDTMTLSRIADIEAKVIGGKVALFVASSSEAGITQLSFDPGNIGITGLAPVGAARGSAADDLLLAQSGTNWMHGGGGDDILIATSKSITMYGGAGADTFVPANLEGKIAIKDYEVGKDRLDLSQLGMVRSIWQLTFVPQSHGIKIYYQKAVIDIITSDGRSLTKDDFSNALFPISHYDPPEIDPKAIDDKDTPSTGGKLLFGGDDRDTLMGGSGSDSILAGAGNDMVSAMGGDDTLRGEDGNDRIRGQHGNDWLYGDAGKDSLFGDDGHDHLYGGLDADQLWGDDGDDRLYGEDGDDHLRGGRGNDSLWGGAGNDRISAGAGHDRIYGGPGNDSLHGNQGNDLITDFSGNNRLFGGMGNDTLLSGAGNDLLRGWSGDDRLAAGSGNDTLHGEDGNDKLYGEDGDDNLSGGRGNDSLWGGEGNDKLYGEDGNDLLTDYIGSNQYFGGAGDDTIRAGNGADEIFGGIGRDHIWGGGGNDRIFGGTGNDAIWGEGGNDHIVDFFGNNQIFGNQGNDRILTGGGHDTINAGWGNDFVSAGAGHDRIYGGPGNDSLHGNQGNDVITDFSGSNRLFGGLGNDHLSTGAGNDLLNGGSGADTLIGGAGRDTMHGGFGRDIFRFERQTDSRRYDADLILDFTKGQDRIDLTALDLTFRGQNGFSGANQLRWQHFGQETHIFIELDNDGAAEMMIRLNERLQLDGEDFLL